jgi:hypothetical protein
MPEATIKNAATEALAAAGATVIRQFVGQTALAARQRLKQLRKQYGDAALAAAIGEESTLSDTESALDRLATRCGISEGPPR